MRRSSSTLIVAAVLHASTAAVCAAQQAAAPAPAPVAAATRTPSTAAAAPTTVPATSRDALTGVALRAMLAELVGDSADSVCVAVADSTAGARSGDLAEHDPSPAVLRSLRGSSVTAIPASACAADERDGGPFRGVLRVSDVSALSDSVLVAHAEAIAEHRARYECIVPRKAEARCRVIEIY